LAPARRFGRRATQRRRFPVKSRENCFMCGVAWRCVFDQKSFERIRGFASQAAQRRAVQGSQEVTVLGHLACLAKPDPKTVARKVITAGRSKFEHADLACRVSRMRQTKGKNHSLIGTLLFKPFPEGSVFARPCLRHCLTSRRKGRCSDKPLSLRVSITNSSSHSVVGIVFRLNLKRHSAIAEKSV
jgi:hypothetical protein